MDIYVADITTLSNWVDVAQYAFPLFMAKSIGKTLFGSSDKVQSVGAQVYPEADYQKSMREQLTGTATGLLDSASNYINQGTDLMQKTASGQLNGDLASNLKRQSLDNYNNQVGSIANNMAFRNLGSNTMTQNALAQAGTDATNWYMDNYNQALQQQSQNAQNLFNMGYNSMQPATSLYDNWLGFQQSMSSPAQTVVKQGSSGLLGTAAAAYLKSMG